MLLLIVQSFNRTLNFSIADSVSDIFERFTYGGVEYPVYQYIRPNTNYNSPIIDLTSDDLRCNQGGEMGNGTEIITVQAGASFSFTADVQVYHDGPLSM